MENDELWLKLALMNAVQDVGSLLRDFSPSGVWMGIALVRQGTPATPTPVAGYPPLLLAIPLRAYCLKGPAY